MHKPRVEKLDQAVELGDLPVVGQVVVPHPVDRPLHLPGVLEDRALRQVETLEALVLHPVQAQVHRVELLLHRLRIVSLHSIAERTDQAGKLGLVMGICRLDTVFEFNYLYLISLSINIHA